MAVAARAWDRMVPKDVFYGWYIVLAGGLTACIGLGLTVVGFGTFVTPMRDELGWSAAAIAAGYSIRSFESGLLSPFTGYLTDRFGPRTMAVIGIFLCSSGLALFSQARELWVYYSASLIIALGQSVGLNGPFSLAVMRWFKKMRGKATGLMQLGTGCAYLIVPLLALMVEWLGWRSALLVLAGVLFATCLPLAFVLRSNPEAYGRLPDGTKALTASTGDALPAPTSLEAGSTVSEALRDPKFYSLMLAGLFLNCSFNVWVVHQVTHLTTVGFSARTAGVFVAVFGACTLPARFLVGWMGDLVGRRRIYMTAFVAMGVAMIAFANVNPQRLWLLPIYFTGHAIGIAGQSVLGQTITADYFGTRRFATLRGLQNTLGLPVGVGLPILAGWMFDTTGSYQAIFMILGSVALLGLLWAILAGKPRWASDGSELRAEDVRTRS